MSISASIGIQMNDFSTQVDTIEKNFDLIYKVTEDIFKDLNDAKHSLNEAAANSDQGPDSLEEFSNKLSDSVFKETDSIMNTVKKLNESVAEAKHFRTLEQEFRRNFENNPTEFREKDFKDILIAKPNHAQAHPIIDRLKTLIENVKEGNGLNTEEDDLVMDTATTQQPKKCPITGALISVALKNSTCDHVYEREAILNHIKGKGKVRCPYAGCAQYLNLK